MVDSYMIGKVDRISPEAPIPIVTISHKENRLGGASNVALNLQVLGAEPLLCTVVGNDAMGTVFHRLMEENKLRQVGIIDDETRMTTSKTRIIGHNQQLLRVDEETTADISSDTEKKLLNAFHDLISTFTIDAIIFEDYDKGVITRSLIEKTEQIAHTRNIPLCVDPKKRNFGNYRNVSLFKPNLKEISEGLKIEITKNNKASLAEAVTSLHNNSGHNIIMVTLAEKGVFISDGKQHLAIPATVRDIADVSGAGDTVISTATLCLVSGLDIIDIARISNIAGGLVCEKVGVVPVDRELLLSECLRLFVDQK